MMKTGSMLCRACGYDLSYTKSGSCPECGRTFSPAEPMSYCQYWRSWTSRFCSAFLIAPAVGVVAMIASLAAAKTLAEMISSLLITSWTELAPLFGLGLLVTTLGSWPGAMLYSRVRQQVGVCVAVSVFIAISFGFWHFVSKLVSLGSV